MGQQVGCGRFSENHHGGMTSVSQIDGDSDMVLLHLHARWGEGSKEEPSSKGGSKVDSTSTSLNVW